MASTWIKPKVNKNGSKSYIVGWRDHNGKTGKKTFRKRREADAFKTDLQNKFNRGEYRPVKDVTFMELAQSWYDIRKAEVRPETARMYRNHLELRLLPAFGGFKLQNISPQAVKEFSASLSGKISSETHRKCLMTLKNTLSCAIEWGYLGTNPAAFAKAPKKARKDIEVLSPMEMQLLIEAIDERYRALVASGCHTGLRISEIFGLKWSDVDFVKMKIRVRQNSQNGKFYEPKSTSSRREIPLPVSLVDTLLKHLSWQRQWIPNNKDDLVFTNLRGGHMNYQNFCKRYFYPALERAGLRRVTPHALRHSYATVLLTANEPIKYVSKLLGHSDSSITLRIYAHVLPDTEKNASQRLEEIFATTALPQNPTKEER